MHIAEKYQISTDYINGVITIDFEDNGRESYCYEFPELDKIVNHYNKSKMPFIIRFNGEEYGIPYGKWYYFASSRQGNKLLFMQEPYTEHVTLDVRIFDKKTSQEKENSDQTTWMQACIKYIGIINKDEYCNKMMQDENSNVGEALKYLISCAEDKIRLCDLMKETYLEKTQERLQSHYDHIVGLSGLDVQNLLENMRKND